MFVLLQSLPGWMSDAERQQIVKMLVPADWLTQDPDYQPQCILPLGWRPPECCSEASCLHVESPDDALRDVMDPDAIADFEVRQHPSHRTPKIPGNLLRLTTFFDAEQQLHSRIS